MAGPRDSEEQRTDAPIGAIRDAPPGPAPRPDVQTLLNLGLEARSQSNHGAALAFFQDAARQAPRNPRVRLEIAKSLHDLGRTDEARFRCQSILEDKPDWGPALVVLGAIAFDQKEHGKALRHFRTATRLNPLDMNAQTRIVRTLVDMGRLEEADTLAKRLLRRQPDHTGLNLLSANIAEQRGDIGGAIAHIDTVAAANPERPEHALAAIHLLRRVERIAEAEARCRELLERQPGSPEAIHALGMILSKQGDQEAALEQLRVAAELKPSDLNFQLAYAHTLRHADRFDEAAVCFARILEVSPDNVSAVLGLANVARARMATAEALAWFEKAARLDPADPVTRVEIAFILWDLFRREDSENAVVESAACTDVPGNARYAQRKFEYFCHTEQWERAATYVEQWPSLGDLPPEAVHSVTRYFVERGKWDDLLDFFRIRIIEAGWYAAPEPTETVYDFIAIATRRTGRYAEMLLLLDRWLSDRADPLVAQLRDEIAEELALMQAVGAVECDDAVPAVAISDPLRRERHALRVRLLTPERPCKEPVIDEASKTLPGAEDAAHTVFFCTDANYLLPTATSLFSLLRHNHTVLPPCRFIVWCSSEVLEFAAEVLGAATAHFGCRVELFSSSTLFSTELRLRTKFGQFTGHGLSEAAYYRMFAVAQLSRKASSGRALYVDADTVCAAGIERLLAFDMEGHPLAARRELPDLPGVWRSSIRLGLERGAYFNSGILLFDLAHPALARALEASLDVALQQQHLLTNLDQCALNLGFKDQVASLDPGFNHFVRDSAEEVLPHPAPTVMHFNAHPKPWDPRYRNRQCMQWFSEFEALAGVLAPVVLKRLAASFIPRAQTALGICVAR